MVWRPVTITEPCVRVKLVHIPGSVPRVLPGSHNPSHRLYACTLACTLHQIQALNGSAGVDGITLPHVPPRKAIIRWGILCLDTMVISEAM